MFYLTGPKAAFAATPADSFSMTTGRSVFSAWAGQEMNKIAELNAEGVLSAIKQGLIQRVQINPPTSTADLIHIDGHKMTIKNFIATDSVVKKLMASGVDLSINWMKREK